MAVTELLGRRRELGASYLPGIVRRRTREPRLSELFTQEVLTALIAGGILAGVPLLFAALGEMVSERAGVLNIGLEGMMLVGAYVGFVAAYHSGSTRLGFLAGAGAGAAVSVIMVLFCVWLGLDQIVVGIAITLACEGATALIFDSQFAESRPTLGETGQVSIPLLSDIPVVGGRDSSDGSLFSQPAVVYIGLILVAVVAWMMRGPTWGSTSGPPATSRPRSTPPGSA